MLCFAKLLSFLVVGKCLIAKAHLMVMFGVSSVAYQNRKQTLSLFHSLRRALFFRLQFLRFCFLGNFESLGKYNADGLAKNFQAEKKNDFITSFQLSYKLAKTIL